MSAATDAVEFGIALGSNLGDRLQNLRNAVDGLRAHLAYDSEVERSPVFATEPVGCPDESSRFYNAVIVVQFAAGAGELLAITQGIELLAGRPAANSRAVNAPRTIDLDLLYGGEATIDTGALVLPHPRLRLRRFVLEPLACVRPDLVLPGHKGSVKVMLDALQSNEPPLEWITADW